MNPSKIYIYLVFILLIISCHSNQRNSYELRLKNSILNIEGDTISFSIKNNTKDDVIFLEDLSDYNYFIKDNIYLWENIGLTLQIVDEKDSLAVLSEKFILFEPDSMSNRYIDFKISNMIKQRDIYLNKYSQLYPNYDSNWIYKHARILENSMYIPKRKTKDNTMELIPFYGQESYVLLASTGFDLEKDKNYYAQIRLEIDSAKVYQYLTKKELDSLKKNDIKIFHGTLKSNKIPIKFEYK